MLICGKVKFEKMKYQIHTCTNQSEMITSLKVIACPLHFVKRIIKKMCRKRGSIFFSTLAKKCCGRCAMRGVCLGFFIFSFTKFYCNFSIFYCFDLRVVCRKGREPRAGWHGPGRALQQASSQASIPGAWGMDWAPWVTTR